jgi:hypothetical protein
MMEHMQQQGLASNETYYVQPQQPNVDWAFISLKGLMTKVDVQQIMDTLRKDSDEGRV